VSDGREAINKGTIMKFFDETGKPLPKTELEHVSTYLKEEVQHHTNVIIGADDVEPLIVSAIANKVKKSLDPVIASYKEEYSALVGEVVILRRTKEATEDKLNKAYVQLENMQQELEDLNHKFKKASNYFSQIEAVGKLAASIPKVLSDAFNIEQPVTKDEDTL
jgi:Skp family chaperone for outer membrane proteins